jgi:Ca-activated chloride channel family protein
MNAPQIEIVAARPAVCHDAATLLDVLIRITPPVPEIHFPRPRLNVALVLDRSGSMGGGRKMEYAREAASFAVTQLLPTDRFSVTVFDDVVETIVPGTLATDKPTAIERLKPIHPRGSTDLHGGWAEGGRQAEQGLEPGALNRVFLLSDGQANVGVTEPAAIAAEARGLAARGVSTTTLGVGSDYNEDLMEAVATAGDGHYYYIETPAQLVDLFQSELHGLMATAGQKVSLGLEPGEGVTVGEVLNDFETVSTGRRKLPNLVAGLPVLVVVRLTVSARKMCATLLNVRLAYDLPGGTVRQTIYARLGGLPVVPQAEWNELAPDPAVREQEALLMAARAQKEASRAYERGDLVGSRGYLACSVGYASSVPMSPQTTDELSALADMQAALDAGDGMHMRKLSKFRSYLRRQSRNTPPKTDQS